MSRSRAKKDVTEVTNVARDRAADAIHMGVLYGRKLSNAATDTDDQLDAHEACITFDEVVDKITDRTYEKSVTMYRMNGKKYTSAELRKEFPKKADRETAKAFKTLKDTEVGKMYTTQAPSKAIIKKVLQEYADDIALGVENGKFKTAVRETVVEQMTELAEESKHQVGPFIMNLRNYSPYPETHDSAFVEKFRAYLDKRFNSGGGKDSVPKLGSTVIALFVSQARSFLHHVSRILAPIMYYDRRPLSDKRLLTVLSILHRSVDVKFSSALFKVFNAELTKAEAESKRKSKARKQNKAKKEMGPAGFDDEEDFDFAAFESVKKAPAKKAAATDKAKKEEEPPEEDVDEEAADDELDAALDGM